MRRILLLPLLLLPCISQAAENAGLVNAINARLAQQQAEVWQLDDAIYKLGNMELSDTQKYELIAEQSFSETDDVVSSYGLTLKQLFSYEATHRQALDTWLQQHPDQVEQLNALEEEIMHLQQQIDQMIQSGAG
jgi:uncharacterized protein Usg